MQTVNPSADDTYYLGSNSLRWFGIAVGNGAAQNNGVCVYSTVSAAYPVVALYGGAYLGPGITWGGGAALPECMMYRFASNIIYLGNSTETAYIGFNCTNGLVTQYNTRATSGMGVVPVFATTVQKSETAAADVSLVTLTPPAVAGLYRVTVWCDVSAATSGIISFEITYHDSNGSAVSAAVFSIFQLGTAAPLTAFTTSAVSRYYGTVDISIDNSASPISVQWVGGGTTTAKVSATIEQIA